MSNNYKLSISILQSRIINIEGSKEDANNAITHEKDRIKELEEELEEINNAIALLQNR